MTEKPQTLLTTLGYTKLKAEYDFYWTKLRPETVQRVADAAAEGDRSENAEYIYGRKKLAQIDKRLRYLGGLLDDPRVIDPRDIKGERIGFGATVRVEDEDGKVKQWTIVGEGESDSSAGLISDKSPVARALLGKSVGDVVEVQLPEREIELEVLELEYGGRVWQDLMRTLEDWTFEPKL